MSMSQFYWNRWLPSGYSDFGSIQIPPYPQIVILTDRADGSLWMVGFNTTSSPERLSINTAFGTIQKSEGARVYKAFEEPYITGDYRLIVRNAHIGLEYLPLPFGIKDNDDPPIYAQNLPRSIRLVGIDNENPATVHIEYAI